MIASKQGVLSMVDNELNDFDEFFELFGSSPEPVIFDENIYSSDLSLIISSI